MAKSIPCIAVDGIDGSGKTTLIQGLMRHFEVALLPRFYGFGMVPIAESERKQWFLSNPPVETAKLYLESQRLRIQLAAVFKQGLHYHFLAPPDKPRLVVLDRGFWSVEAFTFAALRLDAFLGMDDIVKIISRHLYHGKPGLLRSKRHVDLSIILVDRHRPYISNVLTRRSNDARERRLIELQAEFYDTMQARPPRTLVLSPLEEPEWILGQCMAKIGEYHTAD